MDRQYNPRLGLLAWEREETTSAANIRAGTIRTPADKQKMPTQLERSSRSAWVLMAFEKPPGRHLVKQWVLPSFTDDDARQLLGLPPDHPGYADHQVTQSMVATLRRYLDVPNDLDEYDYFVGSQATDL